MSKVEAFLTPEEEQEIVKAILAVEKNTSGEIRVHIESHTRIDPMERAKEVFYLLTIEYMYQNIYTYLTMKLENLVTKQLI